MAVLLKRAPGTLKFLRKEYRACAQYFLKSIILSFQQTSDMSIITMPILQMKRLRPEGNSINGSRSHRNQLVQEIKTLILEILQLITVPHYPSHLFQGHFRISAHGFHSLVLLFCYGFAVELGRDTVGLPHVRLFHCITSQVEVIRWDIVFLKNFLTSICALQWYWLL